MRINRHPGRTWESCRTEDGPTARRVAADRVRDLLAEWRGDAEARSAALTVEGLLGYHRARLRASEISADHLAKSEWAYRHLLARWPAQAPAEAITGRAILEYSADLQERYSPGTVRGILVVLRAALAAAHRDGRLSRLPDVPVPAMPRRAVRVSEEDLAVLWSKLDVRKPTHLLLALVMGTGMRERDALHLTWEAIDWRARTITFQMSKRRVGQPKRLTIPMFSPLPERLEAIRRDLGPLFSGTWRRGSSLRRTVASMLGHWGEPYTHQEGGRTVTRRRWVPGPAYGPHAFRHTLTSRLVDAGATLHETMQAMGHESIKTTLGYYHQQDAAPVLRMRDRLEAQLTPQK